MTIEEQSDPMVSHRREGNATGPVPLVSAIIPTYNRAALVVEAIESVLAQSYPNVEVIVVDDGSTDDTMEVLAHYLGRIVYLRQEHGGISAARNAGMRAATGKYIAWLDSDDLWEPQKTAIQVEVLESKPDVVMVSSDFSAFDATGQIEASHIRTYYATVRAAAHGFDALYPDRGELNPAQVRWLRTPLASSVPLYHGHIHDQLIWGNYIHPPTVMFRRSVLLDTGSLDESLADASNAMEHDFFLRVSKRGAIAYVDLPLVRYRYHEGERASSDANLVRMKLGAIDILRRIRETERVFVASNREQFRRRLGACYLGAAWAYVEEDRLRAMGYWLRSLLCGHMGEQTLKVPIKAILPRRVLRWIREYRRVAKPG